MIGLKMYNFQIGDLGYAEELGNYTEYGSTNKQEILHLARTILKVRNLNISS